MRLFRKLSTLRGQIMLILIGVTALIILLVALLLPSLVERYLVAQLHQRLTAEAQVIAEYTSQQFDRGEFTDIDIFAKRLGQKIGTRVTIIALDGTVVGESHAERSFVTNHGNRPEIVDALEKGSGQSARYSITVKDQLLYAAVPIQAQGTTWGTARVALPYDEVERLTTELVQIILLVAGAAGTLALFVGIKVSQAMARPLKNVSAMARAMADGKFDQLVKPSGPAEISHLGQALNQTAQALRHSFESLSVERERLGSILAHLPVGVILCETDGRVILSNPAAAHLLRVPAVMAGSTLDTLVRETELLEFIQGCMVGECHNCTVTMEHTSPSRLLRVVASRLGPGSAGQSLFVLQDLTDLKQLDALRREFLANVSHELRTPIASLGAAIDALQDGALQEPVVAADFVQRLRQETDRLAKMVEDLLLLARIDAGRTPLDLQIVDANELAGTSAERLRPLAERAGLELAFIPALEAVPLFVDREQIHQVLGNLLHNAIKFTPAPGRIVLQLQRSPHWMLFSIADTGAGLRDEEKERIFERFYKASRSRGSSGAGLGLAIARQIVQAHQGQLWADSPGPGQGATFFFKLPLT